MRHLKRFAALAGLLVALVATGTAPALAQLSPNPTETPEAVREWYLYIIGWPSLLGGAAVIALVTLAYLRYAPRFSRGDGNPGPSGPARGPRAAR